MSASRSEENVGHLMELLRHPGFALLCQRFEKRTDELRDTCMIEENDVEAAKLRRAYAAAKTMHPRSECERLIAQAKRAISKEFPSTDGG